MKMNKLAVARFSHGGRARMWADAKSQSSLLSLCTYTQSNNSSIMWPLGICHTCWVFFPSPNLKPNYHIAADCFPVNMKYKNKTTHLLKGNAQTVLQKCWQVEKTDAKSTHYRGRHKCRKSKWQTDTHPPNHKRSETLKRCEENKYRMHTHVHMHSLWACSRANKSTQAHGRGGYWS